MTKTEIRFGDWLPEAPNYKNPGCEVADNVIPGPVGSYNPFPALVGQEDSAGSAVRSAQQMFDNSGNSVLVGGTNDSLFIRRAALVETGSLSNLGDGEAWDFAQFNDFVVATGANNSPQYLSDIDSDDTWSDLTGSPPTAKRCAKVGNFLMMGNVAGAPNRLQWSALNDPTGSWAASRRTQAGSVDLPMEFGEVQRIVGGRYATVFQTRGITRLSYVGPPKVWQDDIISEDRGAVAPFSVISVGYLTVFLAQDGFYISNGASIQPIGTERVNKWFFDTIAQSRIKEVQGAVDWQNQCFIWAFHTDAGQFGRLIIYSWAYNRWSSASVMTDTVVATSQDGIDLDSLDAIYGNLDDIPYSLDSDEFKPKDRRLGAFVDGEYCTFTGEPMEATWETGQAQPKPGSRVFVSDVTPLIDAETWDAQVQLLMRDNRNGFSASQMLTTGWSGFAPVRGEGNKVAVRMIKPAGSSWSDALGVQAEYRIAGQR